MSSGGLLVVDDGSTDDFRKSLGGETKVSPARIDQHRPVTETGLK